MSCWGWLAKGEELMFDNSYAIVFNLPFHNWILDNQIGGTAIIGLDKLVAAKGHDELNKLFATKDHDELNELVVAVGHDELDRLVAAEGHDELNELTAAQSHNELDELVVVNGKVGAEDAAKGTTDNIFLPISLTKYSAIVAEAKWYFGTEIGLDYRCYL